MEPHAALAPSCRLCGGQTQFQFTRLILSKHRIAYWRCAACFSLQTDAPFWLDESYRTVHNAGDTGMVARTWQMAMTTSLLLRLAGVGPDTACVDWGGGNGLFCRALRDQGYHFLNDDKYAEPFYCAGFTRADHDLQASDVVTAFEVFEHLPEPKSQLEEILTLAPKIWIFSTQIYAAQDQDWSYLSPELGRHVFFYSHEGLARFAAGHGYEFLRGRDMHMLLKRGGHGYLRGSARRHAVLQLLRATKPAQLAAALHFVSRQRGAWRHWQADSRMVRQKRGGQTS